jgi:hypothetical protein
MTDLTHTHSTDPAAPCLACDDELVQDDIGAGMSPSPRPVHLALERIVSALASLQAEREHLEEGARLLRLVERLADDQCEPHNSTWPVMDSADAERLADWLEIEHTRKPKEIR